MKIGDKVNIVDEEGVFTIKGIKGVHVFLMDEYGFENTYLLKQLTPIISHDFNFDITTAIKEEDKIKKEKKNYISKKEEFREIDLHIGQLVDSFVNLKPHQILHKQLNIAKLEIIKAQNDNLKKLILIHGKGKGVLKDEIYKLLKTIKGIEYFEADIIKFRFGAVEIRFK